VDILKNKTNKGWYWDDVTKKLYRWNDLIKLLRKRETTKD